MVTVPSLQNASQLKDGTVLKLCSSPVGAADDLVKLLGAWATKAPEHSDILKRLENEAYVQFELIFILAPCPRPRPPLPSSLFPASCSLRSLDTVARHPGC